MNKFTSLVGFDILLAFCQGRGGVPGRAGQVPGERRGGREAGQPHLGTVRHG